MNTLTYVSSVAAAALVSAVLISDAQRGQPTAAQVASLSSRLTSVERRMKAAEDSLAAAAKANDQSVLVGKLLQDKLTAAETALTGRLERDEKANLDRLTALESAISEIKGRLDAKPSEPVVPAWKVAAEKALRALRALEAATNVGVIFADYSKRVIDTSAEVTEDLGQLPAGDLKMRIESSIFAYKNASTVWNECIQNKFKDVVLKLGETKRILGMYNIDPGKWRAFDEISSADRTIWLSRIWGIASKHLRDAETELKK